MQAAGVGAPTVRKAMAVLQSVLSRAVVWGKVSRNAAAAVRTPAAPRTRSVTVLAPLTVERIRMGLPASQAVLVSVLAYAGLRPQEALALRWGNVRDRTLLVDKAIPFGTEKTTKTARHRTIPMAGPLAADLAELRLASGRPRADALVFPGPNDRPWVAATYRNWSRKQARGRRRSNGQRAGTPGAFARATAAAEVLEVVPYDLRHSYASLLINEGLRSWRSRDAPATRRKRACGHTPTSSTSSRQSAVSTRKS